MFCLCFCASMNSNKPSSEKTFMNKFIIVHHYNIFYKGEREEEEEIEIKGSNNSWIESFTVSKWLGLHQNIYTNNICITIVWGFFFCF